MDAIVAMMIMFFLGFDGTNEAFLGYRYFGLFATFLLLFLGDAFRIVKWRK